MDQAHLYGRIWAAQGTNQNAGFCSGPAQPRDKTLYCPADAGLSKINLCRGMDGLTSTIYNLLFCKLSLSSGFFHSPYFVELSFVVVYAQSFWSNVC